MAAVIKAVASLIHAKADMLRARADAQQGRPAQETPAEEEAGGTAGEAALGARQADPH